MLMAVMMDVQITTNKFVFNKTTHRGGVHRMLRNMDMSFSSTMMYDAAAILIMNRHASVIVKKFLQIIIFSEYVTTLVNFSSSSCE